MLGPWRWLIKETLRGKNGASEGIRTLDIHVGNVTLYQTELRSLPNGTQIKARPPNCKLSFGCFQWPQALE